jgi:hypothetical protein
MRHAFSTATPARWLTATVSKCVAAPEWPRPTSVNRSRGSGGRAPGSAPRRNPPPARRARHDPPPACKSNRAWNLSGRRLSWRAPAIARPERLCKADPSAMDRFPVARRSGRDLHSATGLLPARPGCLNAPAPVHQSGELGPVATPDGFPPGTPPTWGRRPGGRSQESRLLLIWLSEPSFLSR